MGKLVRVRSLLLAAMVATPSSLAYAKKAPAAKPAPAAAPAPASAQPAAEGRALSLQEALALADKNNVALASSRTRLNTAEKAVRLARTALYPTVAAQGKYTHNYKEVTFDSPVGGSVVVLKQEQLEGRLNLNVPLVVPSAYPGLGGARRSAEAVDAEVEVSRADIMLSVARSFYAAAGTDELLIARNHGVEVAKNTLEDARQRLENGAATKVEVSRAEIAVIRAEQAVTEAQEARDRSYRALGTLLQLREPFKVVPGEIAANAANAAKMGGETRPEETRPEVIAIERTMAALDAQVDTNLWRWAPSLSAFGTAGVFNYSGFNGDPYSWAIGLQLDWVLYDGGVRDINREQVQVQRRDAELRLQETRDRVADEVADGKGALATATRALATAQRAAQLATETLELVRVQYQNGAATQLDLLEAQDVLITSEVSVAQARFDLALADLTLRRATGAFPAR